MTTKQAVSSRAPIRGSSAKRTLRISQGRLYAFEEVNRCAHAGVPL